MGRKTPKRGRIAFITTPKFRESSPELVKEFIFKHLFEICDPFRVITTGRTGNFILGVLQRRLDAASRRMIAASMGLSSLAEPELERWKSTIRDALEITLNGFPGMIHVTYELVEGRLDAVIHLADSEDICAKPDSAVLWREANVHNVPIASDPDTTLAYITTWKTRMSSRKPIFKSREPDKDPPLSPLKKGDRVLAIVAHDNMKLETCRFAVEHARDIFANYDYILSTGDTGKWLIRFMEAAGRGPLEIDRIRRCNPGPKGGDIQIAEAVVRGICRKIIFMQDPSVSHPHDSDIRLFEQAVLSKDVHVELATNVESARLLIGT